MHCIFAKTTAHTKIAKASQCRLDLASGKSCSHDGDLAHKSTRQMMKHQECAPKQALSGPKIQKCDPKETLSKPKSKPPDCKPKSKPLRQSQKALSSLKALHRFTAHNARTPPSVLTPFTCASQVVPDNGEPAKLCRQRPRNHLTEHTGVKKTGEQPTFPERRPAAPTCLVLHSENDMGSLHNPDPGQNEQHNHPSMHHVHAE